MSKYVCNCGKEFDNYKSYNGHRGRCKTYLGEERYNQINSNIKSSLSLKSKTKLDKWISERHTCENCGKVMSEYYGSGRFCSEFCARSWVSRNQSEEVKKKKVESLLLFSKNSLNRIRFHHRGPMSEETKRKISISLKRVLSTPEARYKMSKARQGRTLSEEVKRKISIKNKENYQKGIIKGWPSRKVESYSEAYWRKVLEFYKIPYIQEKVISKKVDLKVSEPGCYFLDFFLPDKLVDLEIDGSSHYIEERKISDKIRDQRLSQFGYHVYRIKWRNPSSNSLVVKEDIERFISWYYSL